MHSKFPPKFLSRGKRFINSGAPCTCTFTQSAYTYIHMRNRSVYNKYRRRGRSGRAMSTKTLSLGKAVGSARRSDSLARSLANERKGVWYRKTYSHLNRRPWTAFVGRRTFRDWMRISHDHVVAAAAAPGRYSARITREKVRH